MPKKRTVTPEKVIETAVTLANQHGLDAVTLADIAKELDIRVPSLYNHVSGVNGLHHELVLWGLQRLAEEMRNAAVGKSGDAAITSICHAYRAFAHENKGIYPATLRAANPDEPELVQAGNVILDILFTVFAPYKLDEEAVLHVIRALRSVMHGFIDLELSGGFGLALDRDESYRQLIDLFITGLHSRTDARG